MTCDINKTFTFIYIFKTKFLFPICYVSYRSGSEIYERLPTDASLMDDLNEPLSSTFPEDRLMSPSDDSEIYSHVDMYSQDNSEQMVKPSEIKNNEKLHQGK